jgi:cob(I)alamin adenosyltransferase
MAIHENVIGEMKQKPFTMILILALWAAVTVIWSTRSQYAMAADLSALTQQVSGLSSEVKRGNLETQLRNINSELFSIQQKVADMRAAGKPVDQIYYDRINALQNDKERLTRELELLR